MDTNVMHAAVDWLDLFALAVAFSACLGLRALLVRPRRRSLRAARAHSAPLRVLAFAPRLPRLRLVHDRTIAQAAGDRVER